MCVCELLWEAVDRSTVSLCEWSVTLRREIKQMDTCLICKTGHIEAEIIQHVFFFLFHIFTVVPIADKCRASRPQSARLPVSDGKASSSSTSGSSQIKAKSHQSTLMSPQDNDLISSCLDRSLRSASNPQERWTMSNSQKRIACSHIFEHPVVIIMGVQQTALWTAKNYSRITLNV